MDWILAITIAAITCAITLFTMFREREKEKKRREESSTFIRALRS